MFFASNLAPIPPMGVRYFWLDPKVTKRWQPHYNKYYYCGKPPITRESGGKEEGRLSEAEAGAEEAKKAERKKSPAFAGGRKTERMERASGAPSK